MALRENWGKNCIQNYSKALVSLGIVKSKFNFFLEKTFSPKFTKIVEK